MQEFYIDSAW